MSICPHRLPLPYRSWSLRIPPFTPTSPHPAPAVSFGTDRGLTRAEIDEMREPQAACLFTQSAEHSVINSEELN